MTAPAHAKCSICGRTATIPDGRSRPGGWKVAENGLTCRACVTHPLQRLIREHRQRYAERYAEGTEPALHPDHCGPCPDCRRALADYERREVKRKIRYFTRAEMATRVRGSRSEGSRNEYGCSGPGLEKTSGSPGA